MEYPFLHDGRVRLHRQLTDRYLSLIPLLKEYHISPNNSSSDETATLNGGLDKNKYKLHG